jgi:hypothetical protein
MSGRSRIGIVSVFLWTALFNVPLAAQSSGAQAQFWPELDTYVNLNGSARLSFQYTGTRDRRTQTKEDGQVGGFLVDNTLT